MATVIKTMHPGGPPPRWGPRSTPDVNNPGFSVSNFRFISRDNFL